MIRLPQTAILIALMSASPAIAEQDYSGEKSLPAAQHGQHWNDAGRPWQDAGRQLRSVWSGVSNDARAIGPAVRQDFRTPKRWNPQPDSGVGSVRYQAAPTYQTVPAYQTAPLYQTESVYQPQPIYQTEPTYYPEQVPASTGGLIYLPAEQAPQTYSVDSYAPAASAPYVGAAPATTPIPAYPSYEMAPVYAQ